MAFVTSPDLSARLRGWLSCTFSGRALNYLLVVAAAMAATFAIWLIADPIAGVDLEVKTGGQSREVALGSVLYVTAMAGSLAWISLALFERWTSHASTRWTVFAVIVLFISLLGPLGGVTTGAIITMLAMHLAAGAILILGLRRTMASNESCSDVTST